MASSDHASNAKPKEEYLRQSHQSQMVTSLEVASDIQITLFLCSVCQRQLSAYDFLMKLDEDAHRNTEGFEKTLNICWDWAISAGESVAPTELVDGDFVHDDPQSSTGTALYAYASLWHLVQWIADKDKSNVEPPISNAFNILDGYFF